MPETVPLTMANTLMSIRVADVLVDEATKVAKEDGFSSTQELVREALRKYLEERRMERAIHDASLIWGSAAGKKIKAMTRKERNALAVQELDRLAVKGKKINALSRAQRDKMARRMTVTRRQNGRNIET